MFFTGPADTGLDLGKQIVFTSAAENKRLPASFLKNAVHDPVMVLDKIPAGGTRVSGYESDLDDRQSGLPQFPDRIRILGIRRKPDDSVQIVITDDRGGVFHISL